MQKVLIVDTMAPNMRCEIQGWSHEDGRAVSDAFCMRIGTAHAYDHPNDMPVGLIGHGDNGPLHYPTVLHAIGDGWKLLAPPTSYPIPDGKNGVMWEWWLVKE